MFPRIFLLLILLSPTILPGQDAARIDSLERALATAAPGDTLAVLTLVNLWRATINTDQPRAKTYARRIIDRSQRIDYPTGTATGHQRLGISYSYENRVDSALYHYERALAIYDSLGWEWLQGVMLFNIATIYKDAGLRDSARHYLARADARFPADSGYFVQRSAVNTMRATLERQEGNYAAGVAYAAESYRLAAAAGDSSRMADAEQEIAFGYMDMGDDATAADYFRRSIGLYDRLGDDYFATVSRLNLASTLKALGATAEAESEVRRALAAIGAGGFADLQYDVNLVLGDVLTGTEQPEEAAAAFARAEGQLLPEEDDYRRAELFTHVAEFELTRERLPAARSAARTVLLAAGPLGLREFEEAAHRVLATVAARENDYATAYRHLTVYSDLRDSLRGDRLTQQVAELNARFEREKQDRRIEEQRNRLALLESQAQVDRLQKTRLGLGVGVLLFLMGAGVYSFRQRQRRLRAERNLLSDQLLGHRQQLSTHALHLTRKTRLLDQLSEELRVIRGERPDDRKKLNGLLREIRSEDRINQDWENFRTYFQGVHDGFEERLHSAATLSLSAREQRLAALIKMQLNNQEIASILGLSQETLYKAKYRLRKKLPAAGEGGLDDFIRSL
jgi:DNA-binding CsgD family transcriptional regulator